MSTEPDSGKVEPAGFSAEELAERVYERVAEDESLRGDLTDEGFGPLLDWCAGRIVRVVQDQGTPSLDALSEAFRDAMRSLVAAAETGDSSVLSALPPEVVDPGCVDALSTALNGDDDDPDRRAAEMVAQLGERCP